MGWDIVVKTIRSVEPWPNLDVEFCRPQPRLLPYPWKEVAVQRDNLHNELANTEPSRRSAIVQKPRGMNTEENSAGKTCRPGQTTIRDSTTKAPLKKSQ